MRVRWDMRTTQRGRRGRCTSTHDFLSLISWFLLAALYTRAGEELHGAGQLYRYGDKGCVMLGIAYRARRGRALSLYDETLPALWGKHCVLIWRVALLTALGGAGHPMI